MSKTIDSFSNEYEFLSNFYVHPVTYEHMVYPSTEHAFQAAKSLDVEERKEIKKAKSARAAKKLGRKVDLRKDWEFIKIDVMRTVLKEKFKDPVLRQLLLDTGTQQLVEGNHWGDTFWGVCKGQGKNWLGKLLMEIRDSFKDKDTDSDDYEELVNGLKHLSTPEEKLKAIRQVLLPISKRFYDGAPSEIEVPKSELAALYVLVINNKNWE